MDKLTLVERIEAFASNYMTVRDIATDTELQPILADVRELQDAFQEIADNDDRVVADLRATGMPESMESDVRNLTDRARAILAKTKGESHG